jgi:hypothetical protein
MRFTSVQIDNISLPIICFRFIASIPTKRNNTREGNALRTLIGHKGDDEYVSESGNVGCADSQKISSRYFSPPSISAHLSHTWRPVKVRSGKQI